MDIDMKLNTALYLMYIYVCCVRFAYACNILDY